MQYINRFFLGCLGEVSIGLDPDRSQLGEV